MQKLKTFTEKLKKNKEKIQLVKLPNKYSSVLNNRPGS